MDMKKSQNQSLYIRFRHQNIHQHKLQSLNFNEILHMRRFSLMGSVLIALHPLYRMQMADFPCKMQARLQDVKSLVNIGVDLRR
jgi:hypothetical protein